MPLTAHMRADEVSAPTVGDEDAAREHFAEHELDHGQDAAHHAADDGHAEQEVVLREERGGTARFYWVERSSPAMPASLRLLQTLSCCPSSPCVNVT